MSLRGYFSGVRFDSSTTEAVHRFFNTEIGGHFFTSNQIEMEAVSEMEQFRYEGEAFYAFSDLGFRQYECLSDLFDSKICKPKHYITL